MLTREQITEYQDMFHDAIYNGATVSGAFALADEVQYRDGLTSADYRDLLSRLEALALAEYGTDAYGNEV